MTDAELREHKQTHTKENSWWMNDAKGIPLSRVCDTCIHDVQKQYKPEVLGLSGKYEDVVEEPIEPDGEDFSFPDDWDFGCP